MISVPPLPSEHDLVISAERKFDSYYALGREVECLVQRLDKELPAGFIARPWTLNRAVSIFHCAEYIGCITFDYVEDGGIVAALDAAHRLVALWRSQE